MFHGGTSRPGVCVFSQTKPAGFPAAIRMLAELNMIKR
ncbi:hypothetical protein I552_9973 [Mycobacterium xenopi 3993]|nr:hypothetical protein I552_9973 [Mycobacterium xenopi 3993]